MPRPDPPPERDRPDVAVFLDRVGEGGVSRVAAIVAAGLAEAGLRTEFLVARPSPADARILPADVPVRTLGDGRGGAAATVRALARHLRRERPRVLLSPGNQTHATAALAHALARAGDATRLLVKITNPVVKERHGALRRRYRRRLYAAIFARASAILVLSPARRRELAAAFPAHAGKLAFVHNPYVTPAMTPGPMGAAGHGPPVILSVGRLVEQKDHDTLLRAAAGVAALPWRLVILGSGPEEARLRALADALGIADRVAFRGFVADPVDAFRRAALLALSSRWEDLPAVVLEALACGCPVVATACSESLTELMRDAGPHGRLAPVGDAAAFGRAMAELLADPPERRAPPVAAAYSVAAGVADHFAAVRRWLPTA